MSSGKPVLWDQGAEKDASSSSLDDSNTVMTNAEKEKRWKKKPAKMTRRTQKDYVPRYKSGAYAIIRTLYEQDSGCDGMTKKALIREAKSYTSASFIFPRKGTRYTAWYSMGRLKQRGLVKSVGRPVRYKLTYAGQVLVLKMLETSGKQDGTEKNLRKKRCDGRIASFKDNALNEPEARKKSRKLKKGKDARDSSTASFTKDIEPGESLDTEADSNARSKDVDCAAGEDAVSRNPGGIFETLRSEKNKFELVLIIDDRELRSSNATEMFLPMLDCSGIKYEKRRLELGDFLWILKRKSNDQVFDDVSVDGKEFVMNYIVERKRVDDLSNSISQGRLVNQVFALENCGFNHIVFLIEDCSLVAEQYCTVDEDNRHQAIMNLQVFNGVRVKKAKNLKETAQILILITSFLNSTYSEKKALLAFTSMEHDLMTFKEFSAKAKFNKRLTIKETMIKVLGRISGMSPQKIAAVTELYPTPQRLMDTDPRVVETTLKKAVGKNLASKVCKLFLSKEPLSN